MTGGRGSGGSHDQNQNHASDGNNGNNAGDKGNTDTAVANGDTTKTWVEKVFAADNITGVLKTGITVALVITGIIFLPALLVKALGNAMFGWLPEWARPLALALCCLCCCCSCCSAVGLGIYMSVAHH